MGKVSVYVPDQLLAEAREAGLNFSSTLTRGLARQLHYREDPPPAPEGEPAPASD